MIEAGYVPVPGFQRTPYDKAAIRKARKKGAPTEADALLP
jgi:hypothetical protein